MADEWERAVRRHNLMLARRAWRGTRLWVATGLRLGRAYEQALRPVSEYHQRTVGYERAMLIERLMAALAPVAQAEHGINLDMLFIRGRNSVRARVGDDPVYW